MHTRLLMLPLVAMLVAACNGIGDGNTVKKFELVPASSARLTKAFEQGDTYPLYKCLRDEVAMLGTFDDGQVVQFNSRARWSSSDESVVLVSNRDINVAVITGGAFSELTTQPYSGGTVIPVGNVGEEAEIKAEFAGLSATMRVRITKPSFKIVPVPHPAQNPLDYVPPAYIGEGTRQRMAIVANFGGRIGTGFVAGVLSSSINPILWKFTDGEYEADDDEMFSDYNKWSIPDAATRHADVDTGGIVRGRVASASSYQLEGQFSLCPDETDPELKPTINVRVLPFDTTTPFTIAYEENLDDTGSFTPQSQFASGEMPQGTAQGVSMIAHLDSDGDGVGDVEQGMIGQSFLEVTPRDSGCDVIGLNCLSNALVQGNQEIIIASSSTTGRLADGFDLICITDPDNIECTRADDTTPDPVSVQGCFPACAPRLASLAAESPISGPVVSLTATAHNLDGTPTYVFDCGDGSPLQNTGQVPTADCDYTGDTGPFTASVRILDNDYSVTRNAGAVRIQLDAVPAENTAPSAVLNVTPLGGAAPLSVLFNSSGSSDADIGDSVAVYEFQPEPGVIVRQTSPQLLWTFLSQPAADPSVIVYDQNGVASEADTAEVTVEGTYGSLKRSAPLSVTAIDARPCALEAVAPNPATETAFTFPGATFRVIASFIAEPETVVEGTDPCDTDPVIGTFPATRYVSWAVRPDEDSEEFSEYVSLRSSATDFQLVGQTVWLKSPEVEETQAVIATPVRNTVFGNLEVPPATFITVQPCDPATCTQ